MTNAHSVEHVRRVLNLSRAVEYVEASRGTWGSWSQLFGASDSLNTTSTLANVEFHGVIAAIVARAIQ